MIKMINDEMMKNIKELTKERYGFTPNDFEINSIGESLSLSYEELHQYKIINHLVTRKIYLDKFNYWSGLSTFNTITNEKLIFRFLKLAIKCYNEANNYASICLCRTAIETGLIERVAEENAKNDNAKDKCYEQKVVYYMNRNKGKMLHRNLELAQGFDIISITDVEEMFERNIGHGIGKKILDKFVHGDIIDIANLSNNPKLDENDLNNIK